MCFALNFLYLILILKPLFSFYVYLFNISLPIFLLILFELICLRFISCNKYVIGFYFVAQFSTFCLLTEKVKAFTNIVINNVLTSLLSLCFLFSSLSDFSPILLFL